VKTYTPQAVVVEQAVQEDADQIMHTMDELVTAAQAWQLIPTAMYYIGAVAVAVASIMDNLEKQLLVE
jgi:precorrin-4 methylase